MRFTSFVPAASFVASFVASTRRIAVAPLIACLALSMLVAGPAASLEMPEVNWEGSRAQDVSGKTLDLLIVRPLATARVLVGGLLFIPASILSLPMGREGFSSAHEVFIEFPTEYAFDRKLGEF